MAIYLTYRLRNGKRHGPYGMSGREYLGRVTVKDDLVYSKADGSCLGQLIRRAEVPKVIVPQGTIAPDTPTSRAGIEAAIRRLFCMPHFALHNIDDMKETLQPQFSGDAVEQAVARLVRRGVLEQVAPRNYRRVV